LTIKEPETLETRAAATASVLITERPERPTQAMASLTISPSTMVLDPGEAIELSVEALANDGQPLQDIKFVWAAADTRAGTITADGKFQAGTRPGSFDDSISVTGIQNTHEGIKYATAFASITVVGEPRVPALAAVEIIPDNPTLLMRQLYRLRALGFDEEGLVIPGVSFVWRVNDPRLGRVNDIGLLAVEGDAGTYGAVVTVTGIWEGVKVSVNTDIHLVSAPEADDYLNVQAIPQRFFLDPGERLQLRAVALNGLGEVAAGTQLRWSMENEAAGIIDGNGNFIAGPEPGIYAEAVKVEAVVPGERGFVRAADFASVVIRKEQGIGRLNALSVQPETAVLEPGGRVTLGVRAADESGEPAENVTISWEVLKEPSGRVTPIGMFTAGHVPGVYAEALRVTVDQDLGEEQVTRSRTINVVITGTLVVADVHPAMTVVAPGRTIHLSLTAWDEIGTALPGVVVMWSVSDERVGAIDAFGNFTAGDFPGFYQDAIRGQAIQTRVHRR
jgi:hypothetical protein